jgi:hypothetical protein
MVIPIDFEFFMWFRQLYIDSPQQRARLRTLLVDWAGAHRAEKFLKIIQAELLNTV